MSTQSPISETEQDVLKVLWDLGQGTVREVLLALGAQGHNWAYTTAQTLLTRLMAKGYVAADRSGAAHVYRPSVSRGELLQQRLSALAETFCEGTTSPLMLALVEGSQFTPEEIAQFRELLDRLEADRPRPQEEGGQTMIDWLFTNALAALALAAIAGVLIWTFRPAPAVRHALWLVVVLKLVSPTGLVVSVPLPVDPPVAMKTETPTPKLEPLEESPVIEAEIFTVVVKPKPGQTLEEAAAAAIHMDAKPATLEESPAEAAVTPVETPRQPFDYRPYLLGLWATGAVFISWRQIRETLRFARFTRKSVPAGDSLIAEVAVVANRLGVRP